jgi:DNA-binding transcriptional regulator PaaX
VTQLRNALARPRTTGPAPPLTARSVLASALLGMDPPELPVAQLVRLTGLFGISENRARVALSRMVAGGEATSDGTGLYRLAGHLAAAVGQPCRDDRVL